MDWDLISSLIRWCWAKEWAFLFRKAWDKICLTWSSSSAVGQIAQVCLSWLENKDSIGAWCAYEVLVWYEELRQCRLYILYTMWTWFCVLFLDSRVMLPYRRSQCNTALCFSWISLKQQTHQLMGIKGLLRAKLCLSHLLHAVLDWFVIKNQQNLSWRYLLQDTLRWEYWPENVIILQITDYLLNSQTQWFSNCGVPSLFNCVWIRAAVTRFYC